MEQNSFWTALERWFKEVLWKIRGCTENEKSVARRIYKIVNVGFYPKKPEISFLGVFPLKLFFHGRCWIQCKTIEYKKDEN